MLRLVHIVCTVGCITLSCSQFAWTFSTHRGRRNHQPGPCKPVRGIDTGAGDMHTLPNGLTFITSGLNRKKQGKILLFDLKKPRCRAQELDIVGDFDKDTLNPFGLSVWEDANCDKTYLFVTNKPRNLTYTVEKFSFDKRRLKLYHVRTYEYPTITRSSSISATGEDSFYYLNMYKSNLRLELLHHRRYGSVGFYDGTKWRTILRRLRAPHGIALSPDGKYVYLTEAGGERVNVYARKSNNRLRLLQVVPVHSFLNQITVDPATGDLWVAGHADVKQLFRYHAKPPHTAPSPSQVFRLTMCAGGSRVTDVEEVYYNDGRQFSGSSSAVRYGRFLLIGSVYKKMLLCNIRRC